jgi:hypothetical protein
MANTCRRVEINPDRVKRTIFSFIKRIAFKHNGIIFGGFVRDEIISEYYSIMFYKKFESTKQFWDVSFDPDTKARTLNAEDMDVCFHSVEDSHKFIEDVIKRFRVATNLNYDFKEEELVHANVYSMPTNTIKSVKRLTFNIKLGAIPFVFSGFDMTISIDVVIPYSAIMLPPFNNLDFLCNAFIMTKYGKCLSTCTGTNMDQITQVEISKVSAKIMQDMVEFKTDFCMGQRVVHCQTGTFKYNKYAFKRIDKMLTKQHAWHINNLPFTMHTEKDTETCCICCSSFQDINDIKIVMHVNKDKDTQIKSSITHYSCLSKYIKNQIEKHETKLANDDDIVLDEFAFICPFRNTINFLELGKASKQVILNYAGLV